MREEAGEAQTRTFPCVHWNVGKSMHAFSHHALQGRLRVRCMLQLGMYRFTLTYILEEGKDKKRKKRNKN
jgi:hypothetical protein